MSIFMEQLDKTCLRHGPQLGIDRYLPIEPGSVCTKGFIDDAIRHIEAIQLTDTSLWKLFVNQYRKQDDDDGGWRGEFWGKLMRGACLSYQYTQDRELYQILESTVREFLTTQDTYGRFSTYSVDMEFTGWDMWSRRYAMLGLEYFCDICQDAQLYDAVLDALCRHADYIAEKVGPGSEGKLPITQTSTEWQAINSSSILQPFVRLYNLTKKQRYLDFAAHVIEEGGVQNGNIFELAYEGKLYPYQYPVAKAYEMMCCFEGLLEYYRITKIEKWRKAVENFVELVIASDITITGGAGCTYECFDHAAVRQANTIDRVVVQETCVTVTWIKLCFQLLCLNGSAKIADQMELSIYNALLGAVNSENSQYNGGLPFYSFSPLLPDIRGAAIAGIRYMENHTFYGCCAACGSAGLGLIPMTSVMAFSDGLAFHLYLNGTIETKTPQGKPVGLAVETDYPVSGKITIQVTNDTGEAFSIKFRIPAWSKTCRAFLNGEALTAESGTYLEVKRTWNANDTVSLEFDMRTQVLHALPYDKDPKAEFHIALRRGPVVLARDARFGEDVGELVDILEDDDGCVEATPAKEAAFPSMEAFTVRQKDGRLFHVVDYASAGKTGSRTSQMAAWFPVSPESRGK